jgi:small subunit ribosomal protein S2
MLTNYKTVRNSIARLVELDEMFESGAIARLGKKEALGLERQRAKLNRSLSGIREMNGLPDALFVIDVEHEKIAVSEANKLGIPVVAVVDTNSMPDGIDYIIPGNDDAISSINLYLGSAAAAINDAREVGVVELIGDADDYVEIDPETNAIVTASAVVDAPSAVVATPSAVVDAPLAVVATPSAVVDTPSAVVDAPSAVVDAPSAEDLQLLESKAGAVESSESASGVEDGSLVKEPEQ